MDCSEDDISGNDSSKEINLRRIINCSEEDISEEDNLEFNCSEEDISENSGSEKDI